MFETTKYFYHKYRAELIIAWATSLLSILITTIISIFLEYHNPQFILFTIIGLTIIFLLLALLFNQKRILNNRFEKVNRMLIDQLGFLFSLNNQYIKRRQHFIAEKEVLAKILVKEVLPNIIQNACEEYPNLRKINLFLDSGTTITPVFPHLIGMGIPLLKKKNIKLRIFTNNLAGFNEIHRIDYLEYCALSEKDFNLIGGQPLNRYRATTGQPTLSFLEKIWKEQEDSDGQVVTLSVLTASWFLGGNGLESISLCAKEQGHFQYKQSLINNSQYIILVLPLGKLLRLNDVKLLNKIVADYSDNYSSYKMPPNKRKYNYLLTSFRPDNSLSPLINMSNGLRNLADRNETQNYILCEECPEYEPLGNKSEVVKTELPYPYIVKHKNQLYGC